MTIPQFIGKAIEGGWLKGYHLAEASTLDTNFIFIFDDGADVCDYKDFSVLNWPAEKVLLDPLAWQAVGKMEGWGFWCLKDKQPLEACEPKAQHVSTPRWICEMHRMIDAVAEGKTIEQYLETL